MLGRSHDKENALVPYSTSSIGKRALVTGGSEAWARLLWFSACRTSGSLKSEGSVNCLSGWGFLCGQVAASGSERPPCCPFLQNQFATQRVTPRITTGTVINASVVDTATLAVTSSSATW